MKILVAFDSFKGSLSSWQANGALSAGFRQVIPDAEVLEFPMADGGEGTAEVLVEAMSGRWRECEVPGALGKTVKARYGVVDGGTAVMDVASAIGLTSIPEDCRNPMMASTTGVGVMIRDAVTAGCRKIIVGLGGSATCDGGMGMLTALGAEFYGVDSALSPCGANMEQISRIDTDGLAWLKGIEFVAAYDVDCPLYGRNGAAYVFAPQKGATPAMVEALDRGLQKLALVAGNDSDMPGAGAAGGLGFAFGSFLGARLCPGSEVVINEIKLEKAIAEVDYVITGEGRIDRQTLMGKVPYSILKIAKAHGKPVIAVCGQVDDSELLEQAGFDAILSIVNGPVSIAEAMNVTVATENLWRTARQIARMLKL